MQKAQVAFKFGKKSLACLETCHPDLQFIANELIKVMNVTILCGHRNQKDQEQAFINGKSKLTWPHSKHNMLPSHAMDVAPYPIDWKDIPRFLAMLKCVETICHAKGITIRLGRDFSFKDYPHIELK